MWRPDSVREQGQTDTHPQTQTNTRNPSRLKPTHLVGLIACASRGRPTHTLSLTPTHAPLQTQTNTRGRPDSVREQGQTDTITLLISLGAQVDRRCAPSLFLFSHTWGHDGIFWPILTQTVVRKKTTMPLRIAAPSFFLPSAGGAGGHRVVHLLRGNASTHLVASEWPRLLCRTVRISVKVLINCFWRNEIYYTDALLLLVWYMCVVMCVAQKTSINTRMEISTDTRVRHNRAFLVRAIVSPGCK
jgi:hypothetical protein